MELEKIIESVQSTITSNDLTQFSSDFESVVKELSTAGEQFTSETISAAILKMYVDMKNKEEEKKARQEAREQEEAEKTAKQANIQRFFINVGLMDNLDKDSLKKLIIDAVPEIKDADFSDVYLKDTFSFFELPKNFSDDVLAKLIGTKIGEREINVELSEKKEKSSSRGGRSFGRGDRGGDRNYGSRDGGSRSYGNRGGDRGSYGHSDNHGFAGRGGDRNYGSRDGGSRSYGNGGDRGSYGHSDNRGFAGRGGDDHRSYAPRSNDSYQQPDFNHENPGSYTESSRGRFSSSDRKPRTDRGYPRKKY